MNSINSTPILVKTSGYCMFHDENFLNPSDTHFSHKLSRITKRFKSKLDICIENK